MAVDGKLCSETVSGDWVTVYDSAGVDCKCKGNGEGCGVYFDEAFYADGASYYTCEGNNGQTYHRMTFGDSDGIGDVCE